jgi:hypothetical protein
MLATLPAGGATGEVFWNEKVCPLMDPRNPTPDFRKDVSHATTKEAWLHVPRRGSGGAAARR